MKGPLKRVSLKGPGDKEVELSEGTHVIGRGNPHWPINDKRCSRRQAELTITANDASLIVHGVNPTYLTRRRSGKTISVVKEQPYILKDGDVFTLVVNEHPFTVHIERSEPPKVTKPASQSVGKWNCPICTFANLADASKCEMCETEKEPKKPKAIVNEPKKEPPAQEKPKPKEEKTNVRVKDSERMETEEEDERPMCQYGALCYRRNPAHFKEYRHPPKKEEKSGGTKRKREEKDEPASKQPKAVKSKAKDNSDDDDDGNTNSKYKKTKTSENQTASDKSKKAKAPKAQKPTNPNLKTLKIIPCKARKIAPAAKMLVREDNEGIEEEESRPIKKLLPHTDTTIKTNAVFASAAKKHPEQNTKSTESVTQSAPKGKHSDEMESLSNLKGAHGLAFPSFSTGIHQFESNKAVECTLEAVVNFLELHKNDEDMHLYLVLHPKEQSLADLFQEKWTSKDKRFSIIVGDITHLSSQHKTHACFLANETNWRMKAGGAGVNKSLHERAGPELENETKKRYSTAKVGEAYPVALSSSSPLYVEEEARFVIHCLGPNMNDDRPDSLHGDYDLGTELLGKTYTSLFNCFYSLAFTRE